MNIKLNGSFFVTTGPIVHYPVQEFSNTFRTTQQQLRADRALLSSLQIGWSKGIGFRRSNVGGAQEQIWYSSVETRFPGQVTLQGLSRTVTRAATTRAIVGMAWFKGTLYAYTNASIGTTNTTYWTYTKSTTTWGGSTAVQTSADEGAHDIFVHGGYLCFLGYKPSATTLKFNTYDGSSLSADATGLPATSDTQAVGISAINQQSPYGNAIYVITRAPATGLITISKSTDNGATFSAAWGTNAAAMTFQDTNPPIGRAEYPDMNGNIAIWVSTASNLFLIDLVNTRVIPMQVGPFLAPLTTDDHARNNLVVHQGRLYAITQRTVYEFWWNGNTLIQEDIGPFSIQDSVPTGSIALTGNLTGGVSCGKWLLVGVASVTTTDGGILAYNPADKSWHNLHKDNPAASINITPIVFTPDNVLHYTTGLIVTQVIQDCNANPLSVSGYQYEGSGVLWTPHFTGGLHEINARWLQLVGDNEDMTATETIAVKYGTEYALPSTTSLGTLNNTTTSLNWNSSLGTSAKVIGIEFTFARSGTNTLSPKMHPPIVYYDKVFPHRDAFMCNIDLFATAKLTNSTPDAVEKLLEAVLDSVPLVPFSYGRMLTDGGAVNVAPIPQWQYESLTGMSIAPLGEEREGLSRVFLAERL